MAGVLVLCETKEGRLRKGSKETLSIGRKLAEQSGGELIAVALGSTAASIAGEVGRFGAKKLVVVTDSSLDQYSTESHASALRQVVDHSTPHILLLPGSSNARDLAPRLAARLKVGVASDVDRLEWREGKLLARRPVYSGKLFANVEVEGAPAIATCRPNAFPAEESGQESPAVEELSFQSGQTKARVVETKTPEAEELTIAEADIIVSGGRGLKESANFSYVRDLAAAIGGAVGASRATVDAGWIDHQHQVGQTGRVVSPNLYIAAGISGAIQHLAGMSSSKHIVAINKDAEAPIFRIADLGVIGDLFAILPALTDEVKKARAH